MKAALAAKTAHEALNVQSKIKLSFGHEFRRPLGEIWSNHGLMTSSGSSYDLKLMELVTNMQDAVLERLALTRFGDSGPFPYHTPHEAAADLLAGVDSSDVAELATVVFEESDPPASKSRRLTAIFRDRGCGLTPSAIPRTIFRLGGSHKEDALYMQGAFGLGGAMTYRNAGSVVLVTRRHPGLLPRGAEDRISVAVVEWQDLTKGSTAVYLVDQPWDNPGDEADPWSCPASDFADFEPGTHLALVSYGVEGFHRQTERDDRIFYAVANTRLFNPVMPFRWTNNTGRGRNNTIRGLDSRLATTDVDLVRESDVIPLNIEGTTYHLPISLVLFKAAPKEKGGRESLVAHGHAVMFTSNGQVHHHWSPDEFRARTGLNKVHNRVLAVVETDELPIRLRTSLFTTDRSELRRGDASVKLEDTVTGAFKSSETLRDWNGQLQRESLRGGSDNGTANVARQIGLVMKAKGFGYGGGVGGEGGRGRGKGGSGGSGGRGRRIIELHNDPTYVKGPSCFTAVLGETRAVSLTVDAVDSFFDGRGEVAVTTDHPDLQSREITVGRGRAGRVKVMIAVPDEAATGDYHMTASLTGWTKAAGGLGPTLECGATFSVVEEIDGSGSGAGKRRSGTGQDGASEGSSVALLWSTPERHEDWTRTTVGEVEMISASMLAESESEYSALASLGDSEIPTVSLNEEYPPWKKYLQSRSKKLTDLSRPKDQYSLGVGVALLTFREELKGKDEELAGGSRFGQDATAAAQEAAARAVLAVMPAFDDLIRKIGVEDA
ncbi:MAG: hypothetical protein U0904_05215 [Candidatus Nanopelagicales bacterium]|nr:hypothetical protein [Candidatus Nanopelagicales bacterium]